MTSDDFKQEGIFLDDPELVKEVQEKFKEEISKCKNTNEQLLLEKQLVRCLKILKDTNLFNKITIDELNKTIEGELKPKEICERVTIIKKVKGRKINAQLSLTTYKRIIKNKFYIGTYKFRNQELQGNYPVFISKELFNQVNKIKKYFPITSERENQLPQHF